MVPADSTGIPRVPAYSGAAPECFRFGYGALTPCGAPFHALLLASALPLSGPTTPASPCDNAGLGSSPFDRLYWGNRVYFLFLRVLGCFGSPRSPPASAGYWNRFQWVAPFGHPWVNGYLPLATAFRSLSRPSSPPRAKASSMRPSFRNLFLYGVRSARGRTWACVPMFFAFGAALCRLRVFEIYRLLVFTR